MAIARKLASQISMCGIIGYIGKKSALPILIDGLKRLQYRGYDSVGVSIAKNDGKIQFVKISGRIEKLEAACQRLDSVSTLGLGHTRWATHGAPSAVNAHPHYDCRKNIFVVHNGIIENHEFLRSALEREGHQFVSETDTEVLAHLIERHGQKDPLEEAVLDALRYVKGTYGLAVMASHDPHKIVVARRSSPILLGIGENEYLVASDAAALIKHTKKVVYLQDNEIAVLTPQGYQVFDFANKRREKQIDEISWGIEESQKGGFAHFMLKEIFEAPQVIENALAGRVLVKDGSVKLGGLESIKSKLSNIQRIIITACGTSYYAGLVGKYMIEEWSGLPVEVIYASEFRDHRVPLDSSAGLVVISQSGETADTLEALRQAKKRGALTMGIVNVVGSTISREVDAGIYNHAGPEIAVASTKAFVSQLVVLALFSIFLGRENNYLSLSQAQEILKEIMGLSGKVRQILSRTQKIKNLAKKYHRFSNFLYLGRRYNWPTALEGALKLKEISYIHAEGYPAGEMKHGPLALIDKNFPSVVIAPRDSVYEKTLSNIEELRARTGRILAVATRKDTRMLRYADDVIWIPKTIEQLNPILAAIPLQLFAYYIAVLKKCDIDKPRNLAKSVTVE